MKLPDSPAILSSEPPGSIHLLQLFLDQAPFPVRQDDTEGRAVWFNRAWMDFTRRALSAELGDGWMRHMLLADISQYLPQRETHRSGTAFPPEPILYRLRHHSGEDRWIAEFAHLLPGHSGVYFNLCLDLVPLTTLTPPSLVSVASPSGADLAQVCHDLRTPMNSILGFSEILAEEASDPAHREYATLIKQACHHLIRAVNNLLPHNPLPEPTEAAPAPSVAEDAPVDEVRLPSPACLPELWQKRLCTLRTTLRVREVRRFAHEVREQAQAQEDHELQLWAEALHQAAAALNICDLRRLLRVN